MRSVPVQRSPVQPRPALFAPGGSGPRQARQVKSSAVNMCKGEAGEGEGVTPTPHCPTNCPPTKYNFASDHIPCTMSAPMKWCMSVHAPVHARPLPAPPRASANDRPCLRTPLRTRSHKRAPQPARTPAYVRLCPHTFLRRGGPASEGQQGRTCGAQAVAGALMCRTRYYPRLCALLQAPCPDRARSTSVGPCRARPCFSAPQLARAPLPVRTPACAHPCLCAPCLCAPLPVRTPARVPNAPTKILGCPLGEARSATGSNMKQIPQQ